MSERHPGSSDSLTAPAAVQDEGAGRVKQIFLEICDLPPHERRSALTTKCGTDESVRRFVESLLDANDAAGSFFATPTANSLEEATITGASRAAAFAAMPPGARQIGPYKLLQEIGEGGFGTVYLAEQERPVRRRVALKLIKSGMNSRQVIARFEAERQALAMMDHPNIARVFDGGTTAEGRPYFVMELVQGVPITEFCDTRRLDVTERLELIAQVCRAVQHAHQKGIIHRDLKPTNVLVSTQDDRPHPKVIDFGIAKATRARLTDQTLFTEFRQLIGTPEYMSPEQAEMSGLDVDTRSDVYSLGVMLYELLAGALPFDGKTLRSGGYAEVRRIISEVDPPRPSARLAGLGRQADAVARSRRTPLDQLHRQLRGELGWLPLKAMRKDRAERYASAGEMADDFRNYLEQRPLLAGPESGAYRIRKFVRRNRIAVFGAASFVAVLVAGIVGTSVALIGQSRARADADRRRADAEAANENSRAVIDFLAEDVIAAANPAISRGRKLTVEEALDNAANAVGSRFADHPLVEAAVREALAMTYSSAGRADQGLPHQRVALGLRERELGADHAEAISASINLGVLLEQSGAIDESESLLRATVDRARRVLGREHRDTIRAMNTLASALESAGKSAEGEALNREALLLARRSLGDDAPETRVLIGNLARSELHRGNLVEAEALAREALDRTTRAVGADHPDALSHAGNLAEALRRQHRLEAAEAVNRQALEACERVLGPDHPDTLTTANNLAAVLQEQGKLGEAEPLYRALTERSRRALGETHPATLRLISNHGYVLKSLGRLDEAMPLFELTLRARREQLGDSHPSTLTSIHNLGMLLLDKGQPVKAVVLFEESFRTAMGATGLERRHGALLTAPYGQTLVKLGRFNEAEEPLRTARERLELAGLRGGAEMRDVLLALVSMYEQTGRAGEAEVLKEELLSLAAATRPGNAVAPGSRVLQATTTESNR